MNIIEKNGNIIQDYFNDAFKNNRVFSIEMDIEQKCNADSILLINTFL